MIDYFDEIKNPVSLKLGNLPLNDFFLFMVSPGTLLAIVCYIYLELAFQINYANTVLKPSSLAPLKILRAEWEPKVPIAKSFF